MPSVSDLFISVAVHLQKTIYRHSHGTEIRGQIRGSGSRKQEAKKKKKEYENKSDEAFIREQ